MSKLGGLRGRKARAALLLLFVIGFFDIACTFLLSKEPLTCSTNADCTKYPGTICVEGECRSGTAPTVDAGPDVINDVVQDVVAEDIFIPADPCEAPNKPLVQLKGEIQENLTLKCTSNYLLVGRVVVKAPYTVTVDPGTTVYGSIDLDPVTNYVGTLVIVPGARLVAIGKPDSPIVFTTSKKLNPATPVGAVDGGVAPKDWGGVYMLGEAPVNVNCPGTCTSTKNGLQPFEVFGGNKPSNDSGKLKYVRLEYGGHELQTGSGDGPGLALYGVGDQTEIDFLQIRFPGDDCMEILGGTVNLKHYLCQSHYDDAIAFENGWLGKVQFMASQARPNIFNNSNGIQGRSGTAAALPISSPTVFNATICGQNVLPGVRPGDQQYGVRIESLARIRIANSVFMGWEAMIDTRAGGYAEATTAGADGGADGMWWMNSVSFGNLAANVAYAESGGGGSSVPTSDDDVGFDEAAWWKLAANNNSEDNPGIPKCFDYNSPRFAGPTPLGAVAGAPGTPLARTPPTDGFFDPNAKYIGAFKDQTDQWASGKWVYWADY